jgi:hypothetical protein
MFQACGHTSEKDGTPHSIISLNHTKASAQKQRANPAQLRSFGGHRETPAVAASPWCAAAQIVSTSWAESRVSGRSSV